MQYDSTD